ncbi:lipoprotein [Streptomyces capoamus]|uniref:Lipoprotein n=1 Tax=Streptomyces capoamus TaxID=68183 RepID=A0A919BZQ4_9ACTN|nr:lipoprotein [Streptomyces libani subsp. rufus]GHG36657.1 lipoprotein [Streptomyces capoamus]
MRLCAAAAVSALSLALVTGCGDDGSKDSGSGSGKDADKPAAKTLDAGALQRLIIAQGDVPGQKVGAVEGGVPDKSKVTSDDAKCLPVLRAFTAIAPGDPVAHTSKMATENVKVPKAGATSPDGGKSADSISESMNLDVTVVTLASYDGDGAEQGLQAVSDAVKACAGGFSGAQDGEKGTFTKVSEEKSSGTGDASVAFTATNDAGKDGALPLHAEVARHGNTLAVYTTVNIGAMMSKKAYTVSAPVVKAQAAKLK